MGKETSRESFFEAPDPPPPGETTCGLLYRVAPGDTLYFLANRFQTTLEALTQTNRIEDPYDITPGQTLLIPVLVYRVKSGDTIYLIANTFGITTEGIQQANRLTPPFTLSPGQLLALPIPCELELPPQPSPPVEDVCGVLYIVQPGDTLFLIAGRYNITTQSIIEANQLEPPFTLFPNTQLIIPVVSTIYQVRPGDTLYALAMNFETTVDVIARFNSIAPPFTILPGEWLNIYSPCTLEEETQEER